MAEGTASLGAAKDCLFRVEGAGINDHHVNLEFNGAVLTVSPAQEAEGITVNGKPLTKPEQMKTGDILAFGAHSFEIGPISNAPGAFRRALRLWYIRWPLYGAAGLVALLLVAFIVAWIYLSPDRISGWVTEAVDKNLNCKSKIGSLDYSFSGHLVITDFEIENKPEYSNDAILKIGRMEAKVSVWDLISKKVRLNFTATDPVVDLRRKMIAGKPSWNFEPFKPVPPAPGAPGTIRSIKRDETTCRRAKAKTIVSRYNASGMIHNNGTDAISVVM
ncbi:MAG TPA: FHA domain-containing protein [Planctomycetota bacterium]|nr:FHA domain-containing protein [Planctomycetota bacterium]